MSSPSQSNWPSIRSGLILLMVLIGGTSLYSLFLGRPGDFGAGLMGLVAGAIIGLVVGLAGILGKWLARRRSRSAGETPSSDEPARASGPGS
jgi:hypothetical protein